MIVEQVRLIEEILYYRMEVPTPMLDIIAQIQNKKVLNQISMYISQNHTNMTQDQLMKYLEKMLKQIKTAKMWEDAGLTEEEYFEQEYLLSQRRRKLFQRENDEKTMKEIQSILDENQIGQKVKQALEKTLETKEEQSQMKNFLNENRDQLNNQIIIYELLKIKKLIVPMPKDKQQEILKKIMED